MNRALALAAAVLFALPSAAAEKAGVTLPDTIQVEGKELRLNGLGVRSKFFVKVYVGALFLEVPTKDANEAIRSEQVKRVEMVFVRDLEKAKLTEAIQEGFQKNAAAQLPKLKARLDKLLALVSDVKRGERMTLTYVPGRGMSVKSGGKEITLEGKDFADALFSVWLGAHPADADLKAGMLGT